MLCRAMFFLNIYIYTLGTTPKKNHMRCVSHCKIAPHPRSASEDFLECHLEWGHEKALVAALVTALLGTSMGATGRDAKVQGIWKWEGPKNWVFFPGGEWWFTSGPVHFLYFEPIFRQTTHFDYLIKKTWKTLTTSRLHVASDDPMICSRTHVAQEVVISSPVVVFTYLVNGATLCSFWLQKGWHKKRKPPTTVPYIYLCHIRKAWNQPPVLYSLQAQRDGMFSRDLPGPWRWWCDLLRRTSRPSITFAQQDLSILSKVFQRSLSFWLFWCILPLHRDSLHVKSGLKPPEFLLLVPELVEGKLFRTHPYVEN